MAKSLETSLPVYQAHAAAFWCRQAKSPVNWSALVKLGTIASLLNQEAGIEKVWKTARDAVAWFTRSGWSVDQAGEALFQEHHQLLPGALVSVLSKLRNAYLRHFDQTNGRFEELLEQDGLDSLVLSFAGEFIQEKVSTPAAKDGVAVLVLDAFRYDLGERLAERLNRGEPMRRAVVDAVRSPLPSITALGMAFCLPGCGRDLMVKVVADEKPSWEVTAPGFQGNLSQAGERREWLKQAFKLKDKSFLSVDQVADPGQSDAVTTKTHGKIVFVFGDEADDHDCVLKPYGLDQTLDRYATVVRRLRKGGYSTILAVTDHGFFHWNPGTR